MSYEEAVEKYGLDPIPENLIPEDGLEITIHIDGIFLESKFDINLPTSDSIVNSEIIDC